MTNRPPLNDDIPALLARLAEHDPAGCTTGSPAEIDVASVRRKLSRRASHRQRLAVGGAVVLGLVMLGLLWRTQTSPSLTKLEVAPQTTAETAPPNTPSSPGPAPLTDAQTGTSDREAQHRLAEIEDQRRAVMLQRLDLQIAALEDKLKRQQAESHQALIASIRRRAALSVLLDKIP